jgi:hypothetical protein
MALNGWPFRRPPAAHVLFPVCSGCGSSIPGRIAPKLYEWTQRGYCGCPECPSLPAWCPWKSPVPQMAPYRPRPSADATGKSCVRVRQLGRGEVDIERFSHGVSLISNAIARQCLAYAWIRCLREVWSHSHVPGSHKSAATHTPWPRVRIFRPSATPRACWSQRSGTGGIQREQKD